MILLALLACARDCESRTPAAGKDAECRIAGWSGRNAIVHLPSGWTGGPVPVILGFHGGGGRKEGVNQTSCLDGDEDDPSCLTAVADAAGFAVVYPDGTPKLLGRVRSWNAGGGQDGWRCVGGTGCDEGVDDVAYVADVLDTVGELFPIDATRVFATGISNGAAMSHRLACDMPERIAGIAPIAGENQAQGWPGCPAAHPVPILQIHGTEDPCWAYDGTIGPCLTDEPVEERFVSVDESMTGWAERLGCTGGPVEGETLDAVDDGTSVTRFDWEGCAAPLGLLRIDGGGHTWPGGWDYLREARIGRVSKELVGSEVVVDFFRGLPTTGG